MQYILALLPILIVLLLMVLLHWGGQKAGPVGWLVGIAVAALAFGLTPQVLWVSQVKGVLLSVYVLMVLWPALLLYNIVNQAGGIRAIALGLERAIADRGVLLIVLAWAFSGLLEGLAGFGLPVAVVAPMLASLGVPPVLSVAAVAVGHSWSVTFGDMGVIYQTLIAIVKMDSAPLVPAVATVLGLACIACGMATAHILKHGNRWAVVLVLAILMGLAQGLLALAGLTSLGALGAGLAGVLGGVVLGNLRRRSPTSPPRVVLPHGARDVCAGDAVSCPRYPKHLLVAAMFSYGGLALLMTLIALVQPIRAALSPLVWQLDFPSVTTLARFTTPASPGQVFRFLLHPGSSILCVAMLTYAMYRRFGLAAPRSWKSVVQATWRAAAPSSAAILAMVGLATLMEHCGMTLLLAQGLSAVMGASFPVVSPLVGMLGAFATGSNNNSNVLFASLQKDAALLLAIDPHVLLATQTAGGSLGSMVAPAKIIVGCSTVGLKGKDGDVLKLTLPYGIAIGFTLGVLALLWTLLVR